MAVAMCHQEPDRVPVMCQLSIGHYALHGGHKPHEIWYESEALADAAVKLARRYQFDGVLVPLPGRPAGYLDANVISIQETQEGEWLMWRNGDRTFMPWDDMPHHFPARESTQMRAQYESFKPERDIAEIDRYPAYTWAIYHMQELPGKSSGPMVVGQIPEYLFRTFDMVKARVGGELSVHGSVYSPLTHFFELFGYEDGLTGLVTDREKAHLILDRITDGVIAWAIALIKRGADALSHSSAFVGAPFLSRMMYREFVVPYERRVNEAITAAGGVVYTHSCGRIGDRLDLLTASGTMGISALDPPPLGDGDLTIAKRDFGDRLFFRGNISPVLLLSYRTPEEVVAEASRVLRIGKPGGGYILSTSCSVAPRTEAWKLELLTPLSEEIGRY
jgi:uroporphyrinogen-III decarboxylase